jgi:hypothetical protein
MHADAESELQILILPQAKANFTETCRSRDLSLAIYHRQVVT